MDTLRLLTRGSGMKWRGEAERRTFSIPSAGERELEQGHTQRMGQKRKRDEFEDRVISEEEIRTIHKQHKIRITDLRRLQKSNHLESRKAQKQHSQIFPQPLQSFSQLISLGVISKLISNVAAQGFTEPTEVQIATIPLLLQQNESEPDLLTVAPTGSGKTLAFLIPLINGINRDHAGNSGDSFSRHVSAVILAPTKELVWQIVNEGKKLTAGTGIRIAAFRKGMKLHNNISTSQIQSSEDESEDEQKPSKQPVVKADILVSTPLSMVHAISSSESAETLPVPQIEHLILDEADVLLDPLFREQTLSIWSACSNPNLRTSLWSATIGSNIEEFAIKTLFDRQKALQIRKPPPLLRTVIGLKDTSLPSISHKLVYASTEPGKLMGLRQLLHPPPSAAKSGSNTTPVLRPPFLVFTQTIDRATALHRELLYDIPNPSNSTASSVSRIAVLHSSLSSSQRNTIMTNFRLGKIWILITTDLLSRGVDFRGVNGVVNYDIPTTAASYIHRAGRTGRAGREGGVCVTFYTRDDIKYLKVIANIIAASEKERRKKGGSSDAMSAEDGERTEEGATIGGMPSWLLQALPDLTKADRKDLKTRGVEVRRGAKESDTVKERRKKGKNRIGTTSGYERRAENRKKGAIEGSKRRKRKEMDAESEENGEEFGGFD